MKKLISIILLLAYSCHNNNNPIVFHHGTCFVVGVMRDSIVLVADTKVTGTDNGVKDSTEVQKIYQKDNTFFMNSGIDLMNGVYVPDIVVKNYSEYRSIEDNTDIISREIDKEMRSFFSLRSKPQMDDLFSGAYGKMSSTVFIVKYEDTIPVVSIIQIKANRTGGEQFDIVHEPILIKRVKMYYQSGGMTDEINLVMKGKIPMETSRDAIEMCSIMIKLEAKYHPESVNSKLTYVVIKPHRNFRYGKNF